MTTDLRRSPLDDQHRALGASMMGFGGWDMPLDYGSVVAEHRAVRDQCGVFDLSHLGTLRVTGAGAEAAVQHAFTNDVASLAPGRAHYTLCLDEEAGIIDDLLVYRLDWGLFIVPNAANAAAVLTLLQASAADHDWEVADVKQAMACLAVQGPRSAEVVLQAGIDPEGLDYLDCRELAMASAGASSTGPAAGDGPPGDGVLARSGYTGEQGYELFVPAERASDLWDKVLAAGAAPAGLGARDTLRLEMGYPLHGNDISPETSPVEAGLNWAVKPGTGFRGEPAYTRLRQAGARRRLRGLRALDRGVPRAHCEVRRRDEVVGETTSGSFSPTLKLGVAMAYLAADVSVGDEVAIDVRGKKLPAEVVKPPFVEASTRD